MNTIKNRDIMVLMRMQSLQITLMNDLKALNINHPADLQNILYSSRRGLVQMVGDIFEMSKQLSPDTLDAISLNYDLMKQFRNIASHNYGVLSNEFAYACILLCISKALRDNISNQLTELQK